MKFCRKCHTIQDDNAIFCPDCGTKLVEARRRGEQIEEVREVPVTRVKVKNPAKGKFEYRPQVNLPKLDLSKISERFKHIDSKKIKMGAGLVAAVFATYFLYNATYSSSLGVSLSSFFSAINTNSFLSSGTGSGTVSTAPVNTTPEKKCSTTVVQEEIKTPYTYSYKYSAESAWNPTTSSALIGINNNENIGGLFTVMVEFRTKIGGALTTANGSDVIEGNSRKPIEVKYTGTDDVIINKYTVSPATETRYNTTVQNKTVEKCE